MLDFKKYHTLTKQRIDRWYNVDTTPICYQYKNVLHLMRLKKTVSIVLIILSGYAFMLPGKKVTVFLIGDSTMADKPLDDNPERGWGQLFPRYFTDELSVQNHAVNGRSTKSFINEHRWDTVMSRLQEGDYVMIQFGHNDEKFADSTRSAPAHTLYKDNLIRFVKDVLGKGAHPILITPVMRRKFDEAGKFVDTHGDYPGVVREVAAQMKVPLIDLHKSSETLIVNEGVENSKRLFLHILLIILKILRKKGKMILISANMARPPWLHWFVKV
jgi:DNA sulfur modification protein DndE